MVFAVLSALGIEWANDRGRIREDSAIGIIWSVGMAIGVLFMSLRPGYTSGDLSNFLFGSIVTVTRTDVQALAVLTLVVIVGTLLWLRPVMYVAFDRDFARSQGIPTRLISYTMSALIAVTIVLSIRIMGIVLLISLLTIPVTIVNTFTKSFRTLAPAAAAVAVAGNLAGLALSYNFEVSPGAAIIFTLTVTLILVKLLTLLVKNAAAPMKTIYKLVLKSYLGPMVLTFFIIMFVLMMNVLWRYIDELVGKGLDPGTIIELLCYATINMIPMALPLATLLAAIMTMGNLGENYELLAMKSAGMSLPKIMRPLLVVVSILAVGSFFIANNLVPYANKNFPYDIRHSPDEPDPRVSGRALLQRHRRHEHPRRTPESGNRAADRRTDLRQPQRIGQYDHDRRRFGLYPALGRQALSGDHALQRRTLRTDPKFESVVQQKFPATQ